MQTTSYTGASRLGAIGCSYSMPKFLRCASPSRIQHESATRSNSLRSCTVRELFERVALSCWMRDGDAHLKNFGMLYEHPMAPRRLAPVYDVVCTDVYP